MRTAIACIIAAVASQAALAAGFSAPSDQDVTRACYIDGRPYSKGYRIEGPKKTILVCETDPGNPTTLPLHQQRLRWMTEEEMAARIWR